MTINCIVILSTADGRGIAEVTVTSMRQLAKLMPAEVVSYVVSESGDTVRTPVSDAQLHDTLVSALGNLAQPLRTLQK